jgi:hypothetical protein
MYIDTQPFVIIGLMFKNKKLQKQFNFVKIIDDPRVTKVGKF